MKSGCLIVALVLASIALPAEAGQMKRVRMHEHCHRGICQGVSIARDDFVLMTATHYPDHILLTFVNSTIAKIPHLMFDAFPDLQILRIDNCSVETFEKPQFEGASNLMALFLPNNLIREIPKNLFRGASNLNTLSLEGNVLRELHNDSFNALSVLQSLDLARNRLQTLNAGVFAPMQKLVELNLSYNKLAAMPETIFETNTHLAKVLLAGNQFAQFESEYFKQHPRLTLLDISANQLPEATIIFDSLDTLRANGCNMRKLTVYGYVKDAELSNNSFQAIPLFPHAANLSALDMSYNPIGSFEGAALKPLSGLTKLNISHAHLRDLPVDLFRQQANLTVLDISENLLHSLKVGVFDNLKALQYFYFHGNSWNCDSLQLLMDSFVKRREIAYEEDDLEPNVVDEFVHGVACWYENTKLTTKCSEAGASEVELAIIRNDIKAFVDGVDQKFVKLFRLIEEIKSRM